MFLFANNIFKKRDEAVDIKKMILEIVNTEQNNIRYSAIALEKLVNTVITDYIMKQGKEVFI